MTRNSTNTDDDVPLWTELLSNDGALVTYAQRNYDQQWMNAQELAEAANVSPTTVNDHLSTLTDIGVYETRVDDGRNVYRPNAESYITNALMDIEDTLRYKLSEEHTTNDTTVLYEDGPITETIEVFRTYGLGERIDRESFALPNYSSGQVDATLDFLETAGVVEHNSDTETVMIENSERATEVLDLLH